ncbi:MAG: hypothetical protein LBM78_00885 [Clostridiales bacterium]|jgi:hypothetical protein|nr:hypothetical protein [Clostridiales bacterium]
MRTFRKILGIATALAVIGVVVLSLAHTINLIDFLNEVIHGQFPLVLLYVIIGLFAWASVVYLILVILDKYLIDSTFRVTHEDIGSALESGKLTIRNIDNTTFRLLKDAAKDIEGISVRYISVALNEAEYYLDFYLKVPAEGNIPELIVRFRNELLKTLHDANLRIPGYRLNYGDVSELYLYDKAAAVTGTDAYDGIADAGTVFIGEDRTKAELDEIEYVIPEGVIAVPEEDYTEAEKRKMRYYRELFEEGDLRKKMRHLREVREEEVAEDSLSPQQSETLSRLDQLIDKITNNGEF